MRQIAERTDFSAALSIPTLDEKAWRATEPHTPNPGRGWRRVAELTRAGIRTGVLVAPLMPGINDSPEQVAQILELASEAGAAYVTGIALHLRGDVQGLVLRVARASTGRIWLPRYRRALPRGAPTHRRRSAGGWPALVRGSGPAAGRADARCGRIRRPREPGARAEQRTLF